jgi:hypothetical protein
MRLLNIHNMEFRDFHGENIPPYLVASHRWTSDEATYKDVLKRRNTETKGFNKIASFCRFAKRYNTNNTADDVRWIWIDTCCIIQNSSAEVSESINSMWEWYTSSTHCIAYLRDVRPLSAGRDAVMFDFRQSEWFERGWTLQELLAPKCVVFLTQNYEVIGRKSPDQHVCTMAPHSLNRIISEVTGISRDNLCDFPSRRHTISQDTKMSWAANRRTTKVEDTSYCLLGIFDVHMPLIYGEGERHARKRLEKEIATVEQDDFMEGRTLSVEKQSDSRSMLSGSLRDPLDRNKSSEAVNAHDICPVCKLLLIEPVTTSCSHLLCESCMTTSDKINLTVVPLDSEGDVGGEAAQWNFQITQPCPCCEPGHSSTAGEHGFTDTYFAKANIKLSQELRAKYPSEYVRREASLDATEDGTQMLTINVGNWHELVGPHRHKWTFFVKPSRTDIIEEIHIHLHESFQNPHVICKKPPYSFHGRGWGYFNIDVRVILKGGYSWMSKHAEDGPDGMLQGSLKLQWMLDFESYNGRGAMGRCRVGVRRAVERLRELNRFRNLVLEQPTTGSNPMEEDPRMRIPDHEMRSGDAQTGQEPFSKTLVPSLQAQGRYAIEKTLDRLEQKTEADSIDDDIT